MSVCKSFDIKELNREKVRIGSIKSQVVTHVKREFRFSMNWMRGRLSQKSKEKDRYAVRLSFWETLTLTLGILSFDFRRRGNNVWVLLQDRHMDMSKRTLRKERERVVWEVKRFPILLHISFTKKTEIQKSKASKLESWNPGVSRSQF